MFTLTIKSYSHNTCYLTSDNFSELLEIARTSVTPPVEKDWLIPCKSWTIIRECDGIKLSGWERNED